MGTFPIDKIQQFSSIEIILFALALEFICYLFYKICLKKISEKRHLNLQKRFKTTLKYSITALLLSALLEFLIIPFSWIPKDNYILIILFTLLLCISVISYIKTSQIIVYLYLFFVNMSQGVPRLIANMFTFFITIIFINIFATKLFDVQLSALLATSAVFSLILGLALQDTLGNLFSGISLQIESPFNIGDWIEVHSSHGKYLGQVQEMNWRATFLMSHSDELFMIPNKTIAQSEITIVSQGSKTIRISHSFRFAYDIDIEKTKSILAEEIKSITDGILTDPPIRVLVIDATESWVLMKAFYSLENFAFRYRIGDEVLSKVLNKLKQESIQLQSHKIEYFDKASYK